MLWWELELLSVCLNSDVGKFCWKSVSIWAILPQVTQTKIWRIFTKSLTETSESTVLKFPPRLGLLCDMCQKILVVDLGVWQMFVKFVHRLLSDSQMEQQFLAARNVAVVLQLPHLPHLSPCDLFLFWRIKLQLWEHHFQNVLKFMNIYVSSYIQF